MRSSKKRSLCYSVLALGFISGSGFALESEMPVTWVTSLRQLPGPVLKSYQEDCVFPIEMVPDFSVNSETGGFFAKVAGGRELYFLTCDWGSNVRQEIYLFDGKVARNLEYPYQDEHGNVGYSADAYNVSYMANGVIRSVLSQVCNQYHNHMADYAKLEGDKLVPFFPVGGRLVCGE